MYVYTADDVGYMGLLACAYKRASVFLSERISPPTAPKSNCRVKSGIFGQTAKFGQIPCLFYISNIGIKNKLAKQTVKILMRRLIRSRLIWIYTVCNCVSEFT